MCQSQYLISEYRQHDKRGNLKSVCQFSKLVCLIRNTKAYAVNSSGGGDDDATAVAREIFCASSAKIQPNCENDIA